MPAHPLLSEPEWTRIAAWFGWTTVPEAMVVRNGVNLVYRCSMTAGDVYLRVVDPHWRASHHGEKEAHLLDAWRARGARLAQPLRGRDGAAVLSVGQRWVIAVVAAPGQLCDAPDAEGYGRIGAALAALHAAGDGLPLGAAAVDGIAESPLAATAACLTTWPAASGLREGIERLDAWTRSRVIDDDGPIHGDAHTGNCCVDAGRTTWFDAECAGWGPRCYDLGVLRWTMQRHFPAPEDVERRWSALIAGYRSVRALDEATLRSVPACLALRRLWQLLVVARMPWRYDAERFGRMGAEAAAALLMDLERAGIAR